MKVGRPSVSLLSVISNLVIEGRRAPTTHGFQHAGPALTKTGRFSVSRFNASSNEPPRIRHVRRNFFRPVCARSCSSRSFQRSDLEKNRSADPIAGLSSRAALYRDGRSYRRFVTIFLSQRDPEDGAVPVWTQHPSGLATSLGPGPATSSQRLRVPATLAGSLDAMLCAPALDAQLGGAPTACARATCRLGGMRRCFPEIDEGNRYMSPSSRPRSASRGVGLSLACRGDARYKPRHDDERERERAFARGHSGGHWGESPSGANLRHALHRLAVGQRPEGL
jgi:hypothetical protein